MLGPPYSSVVSSANRRATIPFTRRATVQGWIPEAQHDLPFVAIIQLHLLWHSVIYSWDSMTVSSRQYLHHTYLAWLTTACERQRQMPLIDFIMSQFHPTHTLRATPKMAVVVEPSPHLKLCWDSLNKPFHSKYCRSRYFITFIASN